jgi:hypothetical protein
MAIPSPASDRIEMDFRTMAGISKFHLQDDTNKTPSIDCFIDRGMAPGHVLWWFEKY